MTTQGTDPAPSANPWSLVVVSAVPRAAILACVLLVWGASLAHWFLTSDAPSYVAVARSISTGTRVTSAWDERVFPGWPLTFVASGLVCPFEWGCLWVGVALACLLPWLVWRATDSWKLALLSAYFTPTWLLHSCNGMSEPALLVYVVGSLVLYRARRLVPASALIGLAMLTRPTALFAWAGMAYCLAAGKRWRQLIIYVTVSGAVAGTLLPLNLWLYGDPFRQVRAYSNLPNISEEAKARLGAGQPAYGHLDLPFRSLVRATWLLRPPAWKVAYVWLHVAAALAACAVAAWTRPAHDVGRVMACWAWLNTAFIVCAGPYWGFHSFDRYWVWAMPAYFYFLQAVVPSRRAAHALLLVLATAAVLAAVSRHFN
jgi:hypothetical protein